MFFSFSASAHQLACKRKQDERQALIDALPADYSNPLSLQERKIHALSLPQMVSQCNSGDLTPAMVLSVYAKKALRAQQVTNCLSDIMLDKALTSSSVGEASGRSCQVCLTLDTVNVKGRDSTIGYSSNVGKPAASSSAIVRLLQDAGAIVHAKTTNPIGLLSIETVSDVFGATRNPHNLAFTPGGSTGGGAALLASGGSKIDIGSDIGGSVRIPAHFCGIYSLKGSAGRFPSWDKASLSSPLPWLVPSMTWRSSGNEFVLCEPWQYDHTCIPLPWRSINLQDEGRKLKWGIMWDDGAIPPTPACRRALSTVAAALRKQGHEVVDFHPPDIVSGMATGYKALLSDGGQQIANQLSPGEELIGPAQGLLALFNLPRLVKKILAYFTRTSDPFAAGTSIERGGMRKWLSEGLDFILTVPHPLPAIEHGASEKATLMSVGLYFLIQHGESYRLDYTAGVFPVTKVDKDLDALLENFQSSSEYRSMNSVAKGAYSVYDAQKMHGLPLGVQIVGRRLEEEKVLEGMKVAEAALKEAGLSSGVGLVDL
ncbi:amidase signature enzyme [Coprinellus micaceus]|uniref:Amidase signature enzyme n=1 Tax=Coprinellus micaceus TaxID=71717 RepID=A0A4Y7SKE6_COPMI|nr:amidase signature enzyme [Coprinellus micaceus]